MTDINQDRQDQFGRYIVDVLNHGMLALMVSIGHQTNLFNVLAELPPASTQEIADRAGLQARYVREWLGAMVTGRIIEYDPTRETYHLPSEHAAFLTRAAGANNIARTSQYVAMLGLVEADIIACFRNGGGVSYDKYPRLHTIMGEGSKLNYDSKLIERIVPLSGVVESLEKGIQVLDIGCGQGHIANLMARAYPRSQFRGMDFARQPIVVARREAADWGLTNVTFEVGDIANLNETETYDLITAFDVIHDQAKPRQVLKEVYKALRPDGLFFMMDFRASSDVHQNLDHPVGPFLYTISTMHCMTVSLAQDGEGLGTAWGEQKALELLAEAGFTTHVFHLEGDVLNSYYVARKM